MTQDRTQSFRAFARSAEPKLRHALVARHGAERGAEAANDALVYGWRHWDRVQAMDNPMGYLYRVGQSKARRRRRDPVLVPTIPEDRPPWIERRCCPTKRSVPRSPASASPPGRIMDG